MFRPHSENGASYNHPFIGIALRHLQHAQHFESSCRRSSSSSNNKNSSKASPLRSNAKMFTIPREGGSGCVGNVAVLLLEDMYHTHRHTHSNSSSHTKVSYVYIHYTRAQYRVIGFSPQFSILDEYYAIA